MRWTSSPNGVGMRRVTERQAESRSSDRSAARGRRALPGFLCIMLTALLAFAGDAAADTWRPVPQGCVRVGDQAPCTGVSPGAGLWQFDISPDRRHVYALAWDAHALLIFDRNPVTNVLTQRTGGCLSEDGSGGLCVPAKGLQEPVGIRVSPDGRHVYVAFRKSTALNDESDYGGSGVAMFERNVATGALTQPRTTAACVSNSTATSGNPGACAPGRGLAFVESLVMSPDGRHVYTAGQSVAVLQRDVSTGQLSQEAGEAACLGATAEDCAPARGLGSRNRQIAISPDGNSLYVPSRDESTLATFRRDPKTGRLSQPAGAGGCLSITSREGTCGVEPQLRRAKGATVSPDGRQVYVTSDDAVVAFARSQDGRLTLQSCLNTSGTGGCERARNLAMASFLAVSPDGQTVVTHNEDADGGFAIFERDTAGHLRQPAGADGCVTVDGKAMVAGTRIAGSCLAVPSVRSHGSLLFVDDTNLLVGSYMAGSITSFRRDFYPRCFDASHTVAKNLGAILPLACSDRNGDPLTFEITQPPSGALGAVDQTTAQVFYSPFLDHTGADAFRYRARASGLVSNEATMHLAVVQPPSATTKPTTVAARYRFKWSTPTAKRTRLTRAVLSKLPSGATIRISCRGGKPKCKLNSKPLRAGKNTKLNLHKRNPLRNRLTFRPGQILELHVTAPGKHTQVIRLKFRKGKGPVDSERCIPLGATRVRTDC
jgi:6-phosphogluconolactonase (cycloisomerase 2 family)